MEFNGTFELEDATTEDVWLALSDPVLIADALPGCEFLLHVPDGDADFDELAERAAASDAEPTGDPAVIEERALVEGERYAALMQVSVGPVNPTFETVVTVDERERPRMRASGEGRSGDSSFEMSSWMELSETGDGVEVEWGSEADVFGKVAGMGQRVVDPVANRLVKQFFSSIQTRLRDLQLAEAEGATGGTDPAGDQAAGAGGDAGLLARLRRRLKALLDRLLGRSKSTDSP